MKLLKPLAVLVAVILQFGVFFASWLACVWFAKAAGRFPPTWFGEFTFLFGFFWFAVVCAGVSTFTAIARHRAGNWIMILCGLAIWSYLVLPTDSSRPIALPVFFAVGSITLLAGNGLLALYLRRASRKIAEGMQRAEG